MEKKLINQDIIVFEHIDPIRWKNIKDFQFQDEDIIYIDYVENNFSEYYKAGVIRKVLETDEQLLKRTKMREHYAEMEKKSRRARYEELKKEFEP